MTTVFFKLQSMQTKKIIQYNKQNIKKSNTVFKCYNGCPTKYNIPFNYKNNKLMYSIYQKYQNTFTPKYLLKNISELTNPANYTAYPPGPSNIFMIRHGEKTSNNTTVNPPETYYTINCNGIDRACKLTDYINYLGKSGFPIFAIITCLPNMNINVNNGDLSMRPESTIMLTSFLLNIPMYIYQNSNCSQPYIGTTAINIFTDPTFIGKNILIVWEHTNMQALLNQIIGCYTYLSNGGTNLTNDILINTSTEEWWKINTPIPINNQYNTTNPPPSDYPIPYYSPINYSYLLPYWNTNCFDLVYQLTQSSKKLSFKVYRQPINTCYKNCNLKIGMLQYNNCPHYTDETNCVPPTKVPPTRTT